MCRRYFVSTVSRTKMQVNPAKFHPSMSLFFWPKGQALFGGDPSLNTPPASLFLSSPTQFSPSTSIPPLQHYSVSSPSFSFLPCTFITPSFVCLSVCPPVILPVFMSIGLCFFSVFVCVCLVCLLVLFFCKLPSFIFLI